MKNFIFKSTEADLQKMFSNIDIIQKNVLYCTFRIDTILKNVGKILHDKDLQTTVDKYFDETSHQTEQDEQ